ncbi:MAG TPA: FmdB family transcriptional regulator [Deferribacteraceae bacterium]|nr:FmdB family transcriptional regulator [Deferribacteraceae bacterium]
MPFYEYRCKDCGTEFSRLVFKEGDPVPCTKCSGTNVERMENVKHSGGCVCCTPKGCFPASSDASGN